MLKKPGVYTKVGKDDNIDKIKLPINVVKALNSFKKDGLSLNKILEYVYDEDFTSKRVKEIRQYIYNNSIENIFLAYMNGCDISPEPPYYIDNCSDFKICFNSDIKHIIENPNEDDIFFLKLRTGKYEAFSKDKAKIIANTLNKLIQYYEEHLEEIE